MEKSSFFNSVNGDRKYKADDFAEYFSKFITNGVFPNVADNLQIIADGGDMTIRVKTGVAWINGYMYQNTDDLILTVDVADGILNRIDRVVVQLDFLNRQITTKIKKGEFASNPVANDVQRDADIFELALADIEITQGTTSISQNLITDLRFNDDLCGIVKGTVDQIDTTGLFAQYDAEFSSWFDTAKDTLSGDVAGNLLNEINDITDNFNTHHTNYTKHPAFAVTTGTADNYIVMLEPAPTEYTDGLGIVVAIHADSIGTPTLNVNGLGAKTLKKANGNDATHLKANGVYTFRYNNGNFILQGEGGSGNAQSNQVLSGSSFSNDEGEQTGSMPNNGQRIITPSTVNQAIPGGYHNGLGYVVGDVNLTAENIREEINVFGVGGTLVEAQPNHATLYKIYNSPTKPEDGASFNEEIIRVDKKVSMISFATDFNNSIADPDEAYTYVGFHSDVFTSTSDSASSQILLRNIGGTGRIVLAATGEQSTSTVAREYLHSFSMVKIDDSTTKLARIYKEEDDAYEELRHSLTSHTWDFRNSEGFYLEFYVYSLNREFGASSRIDGELMYA
ncbi:hypothetical protein VQL36_05570 [Chengkuizengella sp. SCS-71B]|uniref:hypothetical protein n=1 Tax=Chengkuizengella sp. SCS-71B TaxID=3115290 RepID=UPI0032C24A99